MRVFDKLNSEQAVTNRISNDLLHDRVMKSDLILIASNYGLLEASITKLEISGLPLLVQVNIVEDAIVAIDGVKANLVKEKVCKCNLKKKLVLHF